MSDLTPSPPAQEGLASSLLEACTVLDEPFHHDAIRAKLEQAAAELSRLSAIVKEFAAGQLDVSGTAIIFGFPQAEEILRRARALSDTE